MNGKCTQTKVQIKASLDAFEAAIRQGRAAECIGSFEAGREAGGEAFCNALFRDGYFRASRYGFNTHGLRVFYQRSAACPSKLPTTDDFASRLASHHALWFLADAAKPIFTACAKGMRPEQVRTYLTVVDSLFWEPRVLDWTVPLEKQPIAAEDLAAAFSFHFSRRPFPTELIDLRLIDNRGINTGSYKRRLEAFASLSQLREAELLVDCYGCTATRERTTVFVRPRNQKFAQAKDLGYLRETLQVDADRRQVMKEAASIDEFAQHLVEKFGDTLILERDDPSRVIVQLPTEVFIGPFLADPALFHEEIQMIGAVMKQLLIDWDDFQFRPIFRSLTLFDIVRVQRLFGLMQACLKVHFSQSQTVGTSKYFQSITPVVSRESLLQTLNHGVGPEKAEDILRLLAGDPARRGYDLQSEPIVPVGDFFLLPLGVIAQSNLPRNSLQRSQFRFDASDSHDPMGDVVAKALEGRSRVARNVKYTYSGVNGELDLLYFDGDHLFAVEMKNSLHPCNLFELRTTLDYVRKAGEQLDRFLNLWREPGFQDYLGKKLNLDITKVSQPETCILLGNRMFAGWRQGKHPIRPIHELLNVINTGIVWHSSPVSGTRVTGSFSLWASDRYEPGDLAHYLSEDGIYALHFASMEEGWRVHRFGNRTLAISSFYMNAETFDVAFRSHPRYREQSWTAIEASGTELN